MTTKQQADAAVAPLASLSRRKLLKTALWASAGTALVVAGGFAWLRRSPVDELPAPDGLKQLSASEYHLFRRAIEVLLPTDGTLLTPVAQIPVIANIDHLMGLWSRPSAKNSASPSACLITPRCSPACTASVLSISITRPR